jgi:phage terminase large subunit-like protein
VATRQRAQAQDYVDRATRYARDVVARKVPACLYVRQACQRQLDDLKRWRKRTDEYHFDRARANRVCRFIELLRHYKGPKAGTPIRLEDWQCFNLTTVFGWVDAAGHRRFRLVYIEVPRGNAKSTLTAAVGLYMLCADGEQGGEVYSTATTQDQARIVWDAACNMVKRDPGLRVTMGIEVLAHALAHGKTASLFKALSAEGSTLDGLNVHYASVDELHAHKTRTVWDVLETATAKRSQPLLWAITTAGTNRSGICYEVRSFVIKTLAGVGRNDRTYGIIYTLDEGDDWTEVANIEKANPNWGVSVMPEAVLSQLAKAMQLPSAAANFKTKYLDVWVGADEAWMDMQKWDACYEPALRLADFQRIWIGLDLATKTDIASKAYIGTLKDGRVGLICRHYVPRSAVEAPQNSQYQGWVDTGRLTLTEDNVTDLQQIEDEVQEDIELFHGRIESIGFDPYQATQLASNLLDANRGMEEQIVEVRATVANFSEPMKLLQEFVLRRTLAHDGDPVLAWMASNVVAHLDAKDNIYPRKERPENKIDGIVAAIIALNRYVAAQQGGSVYDQLAAKRAAAEVPQ